MDQLINTMLTNAQLPQMPPAAKKGDASSQKDGFQKLLEQKQSDGTQAPKPEKTDAPQKPQDSQDAQKPQESGETQETPAVPEDAKALEDQMALAAMLMMQNPVVPVEQVMTPEIQAEAAADELAPLAAEAVLTPETEVQGIVPEAEAEGPETLVEGGESRTADPALAEELPQTIEAPEAAQDTEGRTVEVKVETGKAEVRETEDGGTEETPEFQGMETETRVFEDVKAVPVKVGEAPRAAETEEPLDEQIGPRLTEALRSGETRVELQLTPENLGKVTVEMTWSKDGGLVVQMHAENRETRDLLSRNTAGLEQLLGRETQQEVRVEVPRQEESQREDLYEQQQEQHRRRQQEQRRKQESGEDFLQQLRLGLIPLDGE
ncbi:MAG: hypothetical protein HFF98_06595 [Oscillibacter sp.]|jgi:flagellar hook-length control protein FliK|nr:hypothetical protein [Oscillibacter sp.]